MVSGDGEDLATAEVLGTISITELADTIVAPTENHTVAVTVDAILAHGLMMTDR